MKKQLLKIPMMIASLMMLFLPGYWNTTQAAAYQAQPSTTLPAASRAVVPPADEAARRITVPKGFAIRIFAQNLSHPRLMTVGPDGALYVAQMTANGAIVRLPDRNHDGLADKVEVAASGLQYPNNVEFHNGWMYVAENNVTAAYGFIERFADTNKDGVYETRQVVINNISQGPGHGSRTLHFGPDGKMYVSVGSDCNACAETRDPRRATILRYNADGTIPADNPYAKDADTRKRPIWVWGLRNTVDFLWTPGGQMWANSMGSDGRGDNIPPEKVIIPIDASSHHWYGWPYCMPAKVGVNQALAAEVKDPRVPLPKGLTCAKAGPTLFTAPAHSAPIGMTLGTNLAFPAAYQDDLYVAYHGSWNTTAPANFRDCKVERVIIQNGVVTGSATFATGWRAPGKLCGNAATWGRPAGVTVGPDGALYISDDKGGRVYRVVYTGQ